MSVSKVVTWLSWLGVAPIAIILLGTGFHWLPVVESQAASAAYTALIISFLGAIHWGLALAASEGWKPQHAATDVIIHRKIIRANMTGLRNIFTVSPLPAPEVIAQQSAAFRARLKSWPLPLVMIWSVVPCLLAWGAWGWLLAPNLQLVVLAVIVYWVHHVETRRLHTLLPAWFYVLRGRVTLVLVTLLTLLSLTVILNFSRLA